ncbi:MAG: pilin, partial [Gammaproteobacteria bacterium]|nr:pilin [Gammaproteobacteria bacterium]
DFADTGLWPANLAALGITAPPSGKYVSAIALAAGTMTITYGNDANATLVLTPLLSIKPLVSANLDIIWVCGNSAPPAGAVESGTGPSAANLTTVLNKYMPSSCRA